MRRRLRKAEPSRWQGGSPGKIPHFSGQKLKRLAAGGLGEVHAQQRAVARMMRTTPEEDLRLKPALHVMDAADVTKDLGLDAATRERVERLVTEYSPTFSGKGSAPLFRTRSRLVSTLREIDELDSDKRDLVTRRAMALWGRERTGYGEGSDLRYPMAKALVLPAERLQKGPGDARGGKYYRRVFLGRKKVGGKLRNQYRYYYSKAEYERDHGKGAHVDGQEVAKRSSMQRGLDTFAALLGAVKAYLAGDKAPLAAMTQEQLDVAEFIAASGSAELQARWQIVAPQLAAAWAETHPKVAEAPPKPAQRPQARPQAEQLGLDFAGVQAPSERPERAVMRPDAGPDSEPPPVARPSNVPEVSDEEIPIEKFPWQWHQETDGTATVPPPRGARPIGEPPPEPPPEPPRAVTEPPAGDRVSLIAAARAWQPAKGQVVTLDGVRYRLLTDPETMRGGAVRTVVKPIQGARARSTTLEVTASGRLMLGDTEGGWKAVRAGSLPGAAAEQPTVPPPKPPTPVVPKPEPSPESKTVRPPDPNPLQEARTRRTREEYERKKARQGSPHTREEWAAKIPTGSTVEVDYLGQKVTGALRYWQTDTEGVPWAFVETPSGDVRYPWNRITPVSEPTRIVLADHLAAPAREHGIVVGDGDVSGPSRVELHGTPGQWESFLASLQKRRETAKGGDKRSLTVAIKRIESMLSLPERTEAQRARAEERKRERSGESPSDPGWDRMPEDVQAARENAERWANKVAAEKHAAKPSPGGADAWAQLVALAEKRLAGKGRRGREIKLSDDKRAFWVAVHKVAMDAGQAGTEPAASEPTRSPVIPGEQSKAWIEGNTYPIRAQIKAAGYRWDRDRKAWYKLGAWGSGEDPYEGLGDLPEGVKLSVDETMNEEDAREAERAAALQTEEAQAARLAERTRDRWHHVLSRVVAGLREGDKLSINGMEAVVTDATRPEGHGFTQYARVTLTTPSGKKVERLLRAPVTDTFGRHQIGPTVLYSSDTGETEVRTLDVTEEAPRRTEGPNVVPAPSGRWTRYLEDLSGSEARTYAAIKRGEGVSKAALIDFERLLREIARDADDPNVTEYDGRDVAAIRSYSDRLAQIALRAPEDNFETMPEAEPAGDDASGPLAVAAPNAQWTSYLDDHIGGLARAAWERIRDGEGVSAAGLGALAAALDTLAADARDSTDDILPKKVARPAAAFAKKVRKTIAAATSAPEERTYRTDVPEGWLRGSQLVERTRPKKPDGSYGRAVWKITKDPLGQPMEPLTYVTERDALDAANDLVNAYMQRRDAGEQLTPATGEDNFETMPESEPETPKTGRVSTAEAARIAAEVVDQHYAEVDAQPKVERMLVNNAPPGGWQPEDRVPDAVNEKYHIDLREEARARLMRKELGKRIIPPEPGQQLTLDGKAYTVVQVREDDRQIRIEVKPESGRAKYNRELIIWPGGQLDIWTPGASMNRPENVESFEGFDYTAEINPFHARAEAAKQRRKEEAERRAQERKQAEYEEKQRQKREKAEERARIAEERAAARERERVEAARKDVPPGTPRAEANEEADRMREEREKYGERASRFESFGKKQAGSKKHIATFRDVESALTSVDADLMFTRKALQRAKPSRVPSRVVDGFIPPEAGLALHFVDGMFPAKPITTFRGVTDEENRRGYHAAYEQLRRILDYTLIAEDGGVSLGRVDPREWHRAIAREIDRAQDDPRFGLTEATTGTVNKLRVEYLRQVYNKVVGSGKNGLRGKLSTFLSAQREAYPDGAPREAVKEHVIEIMDGASIPKTFGQSKARAGYTFDRSAAYDTSVMMRKGPPSRVPDRGSPIETGLAAERILKGETAAGRLGGVDYGNWVGDEERAHHLKAFVDSMDDMLSMLGLPPGMIGYNGRLGIAFGARGERGALAHYEPGADIINLTRTKGAGSLAHEWGHFFDYAVGKVTGEPAGLTATREPKGAVQEAMKALQESEGMRVYMDRLTSVLDEGDYKDAEKLYWKSRDEVFARCFERFIQRKLSKAGRQNTYLVATKKSMSGPGGLWPTGAEVDMLSRHFERLFEAFRSSDALEKALGPRLYLPKAPGLSGLPVFREGFEGLTSPRLTIRI